METDILYLHDNWRSTQVRSDPPKIFDYAHLHSFFSFILRQQQLIWPTVAYLDASGRCLCFHKVPHKTK